MQTKKLTDQLRAHVESHYPLLYIVTFEEHDADALIKTVAEERRIIEWNMARGQVDFGTKRVLTTYSELDAALDIWLDMELDNHVLVIKDAHLALRDNPLAIARLKAQLNTDRLSKVIAETQPLGEVMKDKVKEYKDKFESTKMKSAS